MAVNRALACLSLLALGGCYSHGYFYAGYRARVVYASPRPQQVPVAQPSNAVKGSDGTFGWRTGTPNPEDEVRRLTEATARAGCQIESSVPTETRAMCGGVPVLVRSDDCDVFKLCGAGTRGDICGATWARIGR
jgi:hypothetical protein